MPRRRPVRTVVGMEARDPELKKELDATLQARRELGPEYESALIDSFLEKLDQRLDSTSGRDARRRLAEERMVVARGARPRGGGVESFGSRYGFGVVSLVLAVPLSAIAAAEAHFAGLLVAWLGIVAVNVAHAAGGVPWARPGGGPKRSRDDWED